MPIQFNQIPVNFYVPGQYAEFNISNANQGQVVTIPPGILLIGQKLAAGTATAGTVARVTGADQVGQLAGRGSMLHQMARKVFGVTQFVPTYILPFKDAETSAPSTIAVTVSGPATAPGELDLYVGDTRYPIGVALNDAASAIATAIVAAVSADTDRYMDAAVDGVDPTKVNFTARNSGVDAGKIDITLNRYYGETLPIGVGVAIAARVEGTVNPQMDAAAWAALGETWYPSVVMSYTDSANLAALKVEMADRFGPIRQIDGYNFAGINDTVANEITLAGTDNSPWESLLDSADALTPPYAVAATVAAVDAVEPDPSRPRHTLPLPGVIAKADSGRRTLAEQNQLLAAGISTLRVGSDGTVSIERLVSTYRTNAYGVSDDAYFDRTELSTLANLRYTLRVRFATKYGRWKLGQNGSIGANVMTPNLAISESIALYRDTWMVEGWVEGGAALTQFKQQVLAEIDSSDPNRLNLQLPPNLINGLDVLAAEIDFIR